MVVDKMMLVIGGRRSGRLMQDVAALNLESLEWCTMTTGGADDDCFPPSAGHQAVAVNGKVRSVMSVLRGMCRIHLP